MSAIAGGSSNSMDDDYKNFAFLCDLGHFEKMYQEEVDVLIRTKGRSEDIVEIVSLALLELRKEKSKSLSINDMNNVTAIEEEEKDLNARIATFKKRNAILKEEKKVESTLRLKDENPGRKLEIADSEERRQVSFKGSVTSYGIPTYEEEMDKSTHLRTPEQTREDAHEEIDLFPDEFISYLPEMYILKELEKPSTKLNLQKIANQAYEVLEKKLLNALKQKEHDRLTYEFNEVKRKIIMIEDFYAGKSMTLPVAKDRFFRSQTMDPVTAKRYEKMMGATSLFFKAKCTPVETASAGATAGGGSASR